jgi:hypothetical protein
MPTNPATRGARANMPAKDRRAAPSANGTIGPVRQLKSVLGRPLGLQRRDGQLHVVLVERRSAPKADRTPSAAQLRKELSACLLAHEPAHAAQAMRQLVLVHDALGRKGWPGVGALPAAVLANALVQAERLASEEPSLALAMIIAQLRPLQVAAELHEERESRIQDFKVGKNLDVSESTQAEFEELERSWGGTVPAVLAPSEPPEPQS